MTVNMALNVTPQIFTQGYSEVSLNEVSRDFGETNHIFGAFFIKKHLTTF